MQPAPSEDPIVFVGDVHLGRRPTGLDAPLAELGLHAAQLGPAAALAATVDHAIAQRARAVVFAGDLVESLRDRFEAFAALEAQARRLLDAEIPVFAVAGNHDALALPRLVERLPAVHLLGAGGRWERHALPTGPRRPPATLVGWSFPAVHHSGDPLDAAGADLAFAPAAAGPLLGVLHADLDAGRSRYAPLARARLRACGLDAAFVGHVHAPDALHRDPFGYLGSLCGLDAGEPGVRGCWEVRVAGGVRANHVGLAPLLHLRLDLDVTADAAAPGGLDPDALHAHVLAACRDLDVPAAARVVVARVAVVGEGEVRAALAGLPLPLLGASEAGTPVLVTHLLDRVRLPLERTGVPAQSPSGVLAAWITRAAGEGGVRLDEGAVRAQLREAFAAELREPDDSALPPLDVDALIDQAASVALGALLDARAEVR
ncbi:MAG: hypothetical protein RIT45_2755 [Pseudomonadota bacterium]